MQNFFLGIVEITLGMSLLIPLMLLVLRVIGGKFTAKCRYILWTLVLIRLAVPFSFGILPALIEVPVEPDPEPVQIQIPAVSYTPVPQNPVTVQTQEQLQMPSPPAETPIFTEPDPLTWEEISAYIPHLYLTGAAVFLLWNLLSYGIYTGRIIRSAKPADPEAQRVYNTVCRKTELHRPPVLLISPGITSPAAFGLFRRRIVLPDIDFTENGLVGTLSHEVTHCKRGDLWIKAICLLARSFHWFNPLVHLAAFRCEMEMELSCDESVLTGCSEETRAVYGEVMLDIICRCRRNRGSLTTHFNPKKNAVKARFTNILYGSGKRRGLWLIAVCLVLCLIAGAIVACKTEENFENPASEDDSLISEQESHTQTSEYEGFELIEYPYTDKVFPRPIHWNSEKIGEIIIVSNTVPLFSFRLYEWNAYSKNIQSWDKNGLIWELEAYTHESYEEMSEEFHETDYLIGKDDEYTYVMSLPTDLQYIENDYVRQANRARLEEESQTALELFMSINKITPNPDCPVSELFKQSLSTDVRAVWQDFLDTVVAPYSEYIVATEYIDLDGNGVTELIVYDWGASANCGVEIFTIENGQVRSFLAGTNVITYNSGEAKSLAPPSANAVNYSFWGLPTSYSEREQFDTVLWFTPCINRNGHILYSQNGSSVHTSEDYYYFTSDENGCLTVELLQSFFV